MLDGAPRDLPRPPRGGGGATASTTNSVKLASSATYGARKRSGASSPSSGPSSGSGATETSRGMLVTDASGSASGMNDRNRTCESAASSGALLRRALG